MDSESIIDVAVPVRVPTSFHYLTTPEIAEGLKPGSVIQVPFRKKLTHAFVLGFPQTTDVDKKKLKAIDSVLIQEPIFDEIMLKFFRWISDYYCHPIGEVISAAVPRQYCMRLSSPKKKASLESKDEFLSGLAEKTAPSVPPKLNEEQSFAVARILDPEDKRPVLLHGVTGSGKTEVYMAILEQVFRQGKGAIVLVPEIALTPQLLGRFSARFPGEVAVLHSDLTPKERYVQWERLRQGLSRIVVGARSAIFAPVKNLGLVVVDEEHESSFKQEDSLRYHGRDIAIVRGNMSGAKVVLGSATPSMESYANGEAGKYLYVTLKNRVENRPMPKTTFVDLKDKNNWYSPRHQWLSHLLVNKIAAAMRAGQQSMLYLNRLGHAHFLFCGDCSHTWRCRNCDVALTYYQSPPLLKCHYCGVAMAPPTSCEECSGIKLETMGVGTEQVEKELKVIFPEARIARMDRSIIKGRKDLEEILNTINAKEVDIVIGTQMIAKGHDFPGVSLVGILVADASLNIPDFRAHEKTFQAMTQVSGRAGRAQIAGEVVVQTINPEHPVLIAAAENKVVDFYRQELAARKQFGFPPYQRMVMLRFQHRNLSTVEIFAYEMANFVRSHSQKKGYRCQVVGPSEAPLSKLKNLYRWQCMVRAESVKELQILLRAANEYADFRKTPVQFAVDVDPVSAL